MAEEEINSFDDFDRYLDTTIKAWKSEQRMAFTAAMAERWLPVYKEFSEREEWGDPENLRRILEAVWKHLGGQQLSSSDISRYITQVDESTPHMDDYDDVAALAACVMVKEALLCCRNPDDHVPAIQSAMSGFEAVVPFWDMEIAEHPQLWQQIKVRREYLKQLKLFEEIKAIKQFDEASISALREKVRSKEFIEEAAPEEPTEEGPHTITNQRAFEQYRGIIELDIRSDRVDRWEEKAEPGSYMWALRLFATWSARYSRRYSIISGEYGRLADTTGQAALVARQRAIDGKVTAIPDWGSELNKVMNMALERDTFGFGIKAINQPHGYGPSMRRLWAEGEQAGLPAEEAWRHILTWARHRPNAWEKEDQRKEQGRVYTTPELGGLLALEVSWEDTGDPEYPWAAEVERENWQVRLNDFPDDFMYSLIANGREVGDFHDWPGSWKRG
jgi:uncharacterized protein YjaG (DUF416 family)